jgi:pimeloyl-ACP methyl ester carboxylesterase
MTVISDVALPQVNVLESTIAYREAGDREAPVALFLHGNPTSSYIWRNVLPLVAPVAHSRRLPLSGWDHIRIRCRPGLGNRARIPSSCTQI